MYYAIEKQLGGFAEFEKTNLYKLIWQLFRQDLPFQGYTKIKKMSFHIDLSFGKAVYYRDPSF